MLATVLSRSSYGWMGVLSPQSSHGHIGCCPILGTAVCRSSSFEGSWRGCSRGSWVWERVNDLCIQLSERRTPSLPRFVLAFHLSSKKVAFKRSAKLNNLKFFSPPAQCCPLPCVEQPLVSPQSHTMTSRFSCLANTFLAEP